VSWLRRQWAEGNAAALADEPGLGRCASALAFLGGLRSEQRCSGPVLLVAPAASLPYWQGECAHWLGPGADVVCYHGAAAARAAIHDHELWLSPASLDGRAAGLLPALGDRLPKVHTCWRRPAGSPAGTWLVGPLLADSHQRHAV
jgi:hypothetical protein